MKKNNYQHFSFTFLLICVFLFLTGCIKDETILTERIVLKGMQVTWNERMKKEGTQELAKSPEESWFTLSDVVRMKNAGANCLEIHQLGLPDLMPVRNIPNEEFFTNWVDVWVEWCTQNQLYCILTVTGLSAQADWAIYLSLPSWFRDGLTVNSSSKTEYDALIRDFFDQNKTDQDINREAFLILWKFMAERYKNNPYVIYSIMNEPFCQVEIPDDNSAIHLGESYSKFMKQIVDTIRGVGSSQTVIIDIPFLWDSNWRSTFQPVNRDNIVWESHAYVAPWGCPTLDDWKNKINDDIDKIVIEFQKPLFIGEYGIAPISELRSSYVDNWRSIIVGQTAFLDSMPLLGRQYHCWDDLHGEYANFGGGSDLTAEESEWIIQTVLASE